MLLESESQAAEFKGRIEAGEDFRTLAGELSLESLSKDNNGDLGWQPEGVLTMSLGISMVDEYAFIAEVGVLSQPVCDEQINKDVGYWIAKVLEKEEQARVLGMLLGSEEEAQRVRDRLEAGEDFGELAKEFSQDEVSGWWSPGQAGPAFDDFVFNPEIKLGTVSEPIFDDTFATERGYWLLIKAVKKRERAKVLGILLGSEEEAQGVIGRLEAGEDFGELARKLSQHDESRDAGGSLGWLTRESIPALDEFVFNPETELGGISEPIRDDTATTKGGYWLIKVIDKDDNRQIENSDRDLLKAEALNKWIEALWNDPENKIENYLDDEKEAWAIEQAMKP
jgi:parvulin-like peptidyl-prolyl isomerase